MASSQFLCMDSQPMIKSQLRFVLGSNNNGKNLSGRRDCVLPGLDYPSFFIQERVKESVCRQKVLQLAICTDMRLKLDYTNTNFKGVPEPHLLIAAYDKCYKRFLNKYSPFRFGSLLLSPQKQKALWALWAWRMRMDEMVGGVNGSFATHELLDQLEKSVEEIYQGRPRDVYDVALIDTVSRYPLDILLFKDMIQGARVDLENKKIDSFDEQNLYHYHISSAFFLLIVQILEIASESTAAIERIYDGMVTLGIGFAFADRLRNIRENAMVGKNFFCQDELELAGVSEDDIFEGKVTDKWRDFMRQQIKQAKELIDEGSRDINKLKSDARFPLWTSVLVYKQDLSVIEANDYDCFSKMNRSGLVRNIAGLPFAYAKTLGF